MGIGTILKEINDNYAGAIQALTPIVFGVLGFLYYRIYKERQRDRGDADTTVGPVFWSPGKKYKILAIHRYEKSDHDMSGYKHLGQNSRPDLWDKLIEIRSSWLDCRHEIIPKKSSDILDVIISRNGSEQWRVIKFNK